MAEFKLKHPKNRELLGGDLLAQSLAQLGVKVAFGLHGGHLDAFLIGCHEVGIELVDTRHETVAVQAAEGYAKIRFCNGIPGLATAFADRSPIFCITSSPPLRDAETNCLQGFHDQVVLAKPITKFCHRVTNVEEIPRLTAYAFHTSSAGAPGPTLIDFPIDILFSPPRISSIAWASVARQPAYAPAPDPAAISALLDIWKSASRPVMIMGTGARGTADAGLSLLEKTSTPVFYSSKYSTPLPHDHELRGGPAALLAALPAIGKPQPDLTILLGARTGFLLGGRSGAVIPNSNCKLVQVDLDGAEIGKSHAIDLGIVSDATKFIEATLSQLHSESSPSFPRNKEWISTCASLKHLPSPYSKSPEYLPSPDNRLHPYHAMRALMTSLPPHSIISTDGGECGVWALSLLETSRASLSMASTGYLGFLGNGWGYSLGAAMAERVHKPDDERRLVVNIQGDGSAGFHVAELDTFARHHLRILTVVVNNSCWGMSLNGQELVYGGKTDVRPVSRLSARTKYDVVAAGFGCRADRVEKLDDVKGAVERLTSTANGNQGPALIDLIVSDKPITDATRGMVGMPEKGEGEHVVVVPYYDNVPRAYYKEKGEVAANGH